MLGDLAIRRHSGSPLAWARGSRRVSGEREAGNVKQTPYDECRPLSFGRRSLQRVVAGGKLPNRLKRFGVARIRTKLQIL